MSVVCVGEGRYQCASVIFPEKDYYNFLLTEATFQYQFFFHQFKFSMLTNTMWSTICNSNYEKKRKSSLQCSYNKTRKCL